MIDVDALSKVYTVSGGSDVVAVDGISFRVEPGEVYGLLGPNGAGKTTTLRVILGLLRPTSGSARIASFDATTQPEEVKRRVGLVSALTGVYPWQTARETLLYFADLYDVPIDQAQESIATLARIFGLTDLMDRRCVTFSTGQRQRLNLARALLHDPPVLLLDEPTVGLDIIGRQVVDEFIALGKRRGKAVLLCTHHLDEAERVCTRIGLLNRGRLVIEGTLSELAEATGRPTLHEMFLELTKIGPALEEAGA